MKKFLSFIIAISIIVLLPGCTSSKVSDKKIKEDLQSIYGVTNYTITEHLTDTNSNYDSINVSTSIHKNSWEFVYKIYLNYSHYKQGWVLESHNAVMDSFIAVKEPSQEDILNGLGIEKKDLLNLYKATEYFNYGNGEILYAISFVKHYNTYPDEKIIGYAKAFYSSSFVVESMISNVLFPPYQGDFESIPLWNYEISAIAEITPYGG